MIKDRILRTVRLIEPQKDHRFGQAELTLNDFDSHHGAILFGDPGMGKSTEFDAATRGVDEKYCVSAHEFLRCDPDDDPIWRTKTLFIDGLDEVRIGGGDPNTVLDQIITKIKGLGTPKFRLSLRPSSWLCKSDLGKVSSLLGINEIPVLLLNPLNEDNVLEVISHHRIDVDAFIQQARELGMDAVLGNPLLLDLLVTSVKLGQWPDISSNLLEIACHELVQNRHQKCRDTDLLHQLQSDDSILTLAGKLCAFMLITNKSGWSSTATDNPEILSIRDIEGDQDLSIQEALNSRIFQGASHFRIPAHRLVAEFLGAYYLSRKIENGASVRRVLALLMEHDGILLPDLRGLAAWLATLNQQARSILIQTDPVAIAFNADTKGFSYEEYRELLAKLEEHSPRITDCIFAGTLDGLCGNERVSIIQDLSTMPGRTQNRQALVYLLLRGFSKTCNSTKESDLEKDHKCLLNIIRDHRWQSNVRIEALNALSRILHDTPQHGLRLRKIVYQLRRQKIVDEKDELQTTLLYILYPDDIPPIEIWDFLVDGRFKYPDGRTSTQVSLGKSLINQGTTRYLNYWILFVNMPAGSSRNYKI